MLRKKLERVPAYKDRVFLFLSRLSDLKPVQWLVKHKEQIALFLYILWLAGCGYWFYQFLVIDVRPQTDWIFITDDTREAMVFVFFGSFGLVFVLAFVFFIVKLMYNLFHEGIQFLFPFQWFSLAKSISYLLVLGFAFIYIENIKVVGLTAYNQIDVIVHTSRQHDNEVEKNLNNLIRVIDKEKKYFE
jgi:hypothetical protein